MRGGTLFSGIGAPECAAPAIDWRWAAEIDPFASAVYRTHFPGVPNLGDVTTMDWQEAEKVDVVVFGSPCQSFSVAGRRGGLDDPRGNLALLALDAIDRVRPTWLVFDYEKPSDMWSRSGDIAAAAVLTVKMLYIITTFPSPSALPVACREP